ncbi:helix-turn-helix domain-containing protein [Vagococcus fluvialis]|uniref:helix-turn-helix domain-containing protein n=1 Tax=Vagococcus fluvialis TaxID=2738 RepID=UPI001D0A39E9|nr:helix-turn-helix transcriptional regulator [Vagococcus fluvialis]
MSYSLGQKIRCIRNDLGMTLNEFGRVIDRGESLKKVRSGTVSNWEQGLNKPNAKRLKRIAEIGNTTVDELLKSEYEICDNCSYDILKKEFKFCPICGTKKSS